MARWSLPAILVLAAVLHALGIARTLVPAQDGLKYIRVAKRFQIDHWTDAVRASDQHPLYSALIAGAQPAVARIVGVGHESWRIAAQLVSAIASVLLLIPLYAFSSRLFNPRIALLAALLFVLLPIPAEVGHDTLSDTPALLCFLLSLALGQCAITSGRMFEWLLAGLVAGIGYWIRPETVLAGPAIVLAALSCQAHPRPLKTRLGGIALLTLGLAGVAALFVLVKGDISEKIALRTQTGSSAHLVHRTVPQRLPEGLDDPKWDFAPKEESGRQDHHGALDAAGEVVTLWFEGMGFLFGPLTIWGIVRTRPRGPGAAIALTYSLVFVAVVVKHASTLGYVSHRHVLSLIALSLPFASAAIFLICGRLARILRLAPKVSRAIGAALIASLVALGVISQSRVSHVSRWGHWSAGRWLAQNAAPGEAVLDTRGWAAFVSEMPSYDYWHVRQALSDSNLAWIVVGGDELIAHSRRAETLRALLRRAGSPANSFPESEGGRGKGVLIYRFQRPESWEGLE